MRAYFLVSRNGSFEIVEDRKFKPEKYPNQNIIIYGNKDNNSVWKKLLKDGPVQVSNDEVKFGDIKLTGSHWGMYFIVQRIDSDHARIGVITASGIKGMKATYAYHYLVNGTTFPDVLLFDDSVLINGSSSVKCAGFFGNDWSIESGEFKWN